MLKSRSLIAVLAGVLLAGASPLALADPGNGKGQGHSKHSSQGDQGGMARGRSQAPMTGVMAPVSIAAVSWAYWVGTVTTGARDRHCLQAFRKTWLGANLCPRELPRSWTTGYWGSFLAMTVMNGGRPEPT